MGVEKLGTYLRYIEVLTGIRYIGFQTYGRKEINNLVFVCFIKVTTGTSFIGFRNRGFFIRSLC